jgi:hypothetical protein
MTASLTRGSKVFEILEGGAATRKAGRRELNVFAQWGTAFDRHDLQSEGLPQLVGIGNNSAAARPI